MSARIPSALKRQLVFAATFTAAGVTLLWAVRPLPDPDAVLASCVSSTPDNSDHLAPVAPARHLALDIRAFDTPLWIAPPSPPAPPPPTPPPAPPPPIKMQLVAIVVHATPVAGTGPDPAVVSALFYDPGADRLVTLKRGDLLAGRRIEAISPQGVTIQEGNSVRTLALREEQPTPTDLFAPRPAVGGGR